MKRTVRFGIIGCGLMGREFASAAARWCHLNVDVARPEIVAVCDSNPEATHWFQENFPSVRLATSDYKELLALRDVDAVYCAVPHSLHREIYVDIINSGKHFMGEKPFGMDMEANEAILAAARQHPESVVRCASEFPFYPACQQLIRWIGEGRFGRIIEVRAGFNHSSDMDLTKPINWKRRAAINGEYGCMAIWASTRSMCRCAWVGVRRACTATLSKLCVERPDGKGGTAACDTWDNATLVCETEAPDGQMFPMYLETKRMSPGSTDEWFLEVYGMDCSARFNANDPNAFSYTQAWGKEQAWCRINVGYKPLFPTITGGIFEFGFTDAILQMWCAFLMEIEGRDVRSMLHAGETGLSHAIQTAALQSHRERRAVEIL
jgi:predicted dehydrogenase